MTRDQAIAAFNGIENAHSASAESWIDRFVALGMLKLDPSTYPETPLDKLIKSLRMNHAKNEEITALMQSLTEQGLEVAVKTKR